MTAQAAAVAAPAASSSRAISRGEVIQAAHAGSPWGFLPIGLAALRSRPDDHEVRFLVAVGFARLALVTAAREHLEMLPAAMRASGPAAELGAAVSRLPSDRLELAGLAQTCRANLEALAGRADDPVDLRPHFEAWERRAGLCEWFGARDGNILRRVVDPANPAGRPELDRWVGLQDIKGQVAAVTLPHVAVKTGGPARPYVLEGADPPWMVERVLRETPPGADGYQPRVTLIHEDPLELLDGLAQVDLTGLLASGRVRVIVGPGAAGKLASALDGVETQVVGPALSLSTVRTPAAPPVQAVVEAAGKRQLFEQQRLAAQVREMYGGRTAAWWAERYGRCLGSEGRVVEPLRVLIPTCRFSTYIKHAAADLAAGFEAIGCRARVMMEPDDHSQLTGVAYLKAVAELEPDLVVLINYTRANVNNSLDVPAGRPGPADVLPVEVPLVTWVQDAMPHQLDPRVGRAMGPLDFVAGNLRNELFLRFEYPRARAMHAAIVASSAKFHAGPVAPARRERYACEIAYVSHHAETPAALHARKCAEARTSPGLVELLEVLRPLVERETLSRMGEPLIARVREAVKSSLRVRGLNPDDEAMVERLMQMYALPLADRLVRHQTVEWAAGIARRRGWRMHLYGKGWESHPHVGSLARGAAEHGEDLRACYQSARAHLQVSAHSLIHQRIFECVLSGGLPLCRLQADDLTSLEYEAAAECVLARLSAGQDGAPDACDPWARYRGHYRRLGYATASGVKAMQYAALRQRLGLEASEMVWINSAHVESLANGPPAGGVMPEERSIAWLFGDPAEHLFADEAGLERLLERAVEDEAWRRARVESIAARVRARLTHEAFATRLLGLVRSGLE